MRYFVHTVGCKLLLDLTVAEDLGQKPQRSYIGRTMDSSQAVHFFITINQNYKLKYFQAVRSVRRKDVSRTRSLRHAEFHARSISTQ